MEEKMNEFRHKSLDDDLKYKPTKYIADHTVSGDDTLSHIALKYYGSAAKEKWMLIYQTRFMAQLLGVKNIRVNAVAPGVTMSPATKAVVPQQIIDSITASTALHATLEPEDMTGVIVFLASDDSSKMTGQILINDAGSWFTG